MEIHYFLLYLALILLSARFFGELAARCKIPSVIGELFAGLFIGPTLFGWVPLTEMIQVFAEIGIILLLFQVGIETNVSRLTQTGSKPFLVAFGGVVLPFVLGFYASYSLFSIGMIPSLFIASTLTATSIGITIRVLHDLKQEESDEAQIVLGAAVVDDIIGIILLSIIYEFSQGAGFDLGKIVIGLLFILFFLLLGPLVARWIAQLFSKFTSLSSVPGFVTVSALALIFFFSWLAHEIGAPALLGGFAAGIGLSKQFPLRKAGLNLPQSYSHAVEKETKPIVDFFTPIFFVAIGLALNLREVPWGDSSVLSLALVILFVAVLGKILAGFFLFKEPSFIKWAVGLAMVPRGEVGLIFAEVGRNTKVFDNDLYAVMVIVISITTIFAPILLRLFYHYFKRPVIDVKKS